MRKFCAVAACLMFAAHAHAANWQVDAAKSSLTFEATQAGDAFKGGFSQFTSTIDFDEAAPEKGHIEVTVAMASVTVEGKDRQEALPTADWFATAQFPTAQFVSAAIARTGPHAYVAQGTLTLRGIGKPVSLPFTLTPEGSVTRAEGSFTLNRSDYSIGQGRWASDEWVPLPVTVRFSLLASMK